jgi:hypothetical protein
MSTPDETPDDDLDRQVRTPYPWREVLKELEKRVAAARASGKPIPAEILEDVAYVDDVFHYANSFRRLNDTINLPEDWSLSEVLAVLGPREIVVPGSDESWRRIRRRFDMTQDGGSATSSDARTL